MSTLFAGLRITLAVALLILLAGLRASLAAPDENILGKAQGYPVAPAIGESRQENYRVGSFSALDTLGPSCTLAPAPVPLALPQEKATNFAYCFHGTNLTLDDYMQRHRGAGAARWPDRRRAV